MTRRIPAHPLAEHPLDGLETIPHCTYPLTDRAHLALLMLESSLQRCAGYVRGDLLDVGCGRKPYAGTAFENARRYVGMDYLTDRSRPDVVGSALHLPFRTASFDTVASTEVLEHVPEPLQALREMRRVLRPEGHLILSTPMYWPRHEVPYDFFRYPYDGLLALLAASDFELVRLYNRGRSYVFIGQVIQFVHPIPWAWFVALVNRFFLWCDSHLQHDALTLGWTVVARPKRSALHVANGG